jgi:enoyl-CoA hydratase
MSIGYSICLKENIMAYENIVLEVRDEIAYLRVDRPKVLNALNAATIGELETALERVASDEGIRALVWHGEGKAFIAGADIRELTVLNPLGAKRIARRGQELLNRLENLGKPSVAAINGFALGGGCEMALGCTLRVAARSARIGLPEVGLGVIPGYGGTQRLTRIVGKGRALELILTGDPIPAEEAHRIGLVNRVVDDAELLDAATALAQRILKNGPLAVAAAMESVNRGSDLALDDGQVLESSLFGVLAGTEDMREGTSAFMEKRPARFTGR